MKKNYFLSIAAIVLVTAVSQAQIKVGDNPTSINESAVVDIQSTNKGLLLPRVALTSTTVFAPLAAHVQGMQVYNTAITGDVTEGVYYNDGTKWVKAVTGAVATEPWNVVGTTTPATLNTQSIYQMGSIGVNNQDPKTEFHINQAGVTSNIVRSYLKSGLVFTGDSPFMGDGIGMYFENISLPVNQKIVKLEFMKTAADHSYFGYTGVSDNAGDFVQDYYGIDLKKGYFSIGHYRGVGVSEKLDVNGRVRVRNLPLDGSANSVNTAADPEVQENFTATNVVVANANGVLGSKPFSAFAAPIEPWNKVGTTIGSMSNTDNIYQMGKVGINMNLLPQTNFEVNGDGYFRSVLSVGPQIGGYITNANSILSVGGLAGDTRTIGQFSLNNCGGACAQQSAHNLVLNNPNGNNWLYANIAFVSKANDIGLNPAPSSEIYGIDRDATNNYGGLSIKTRNATDYADRFTIRASGLIGINTTTPSEQLDVNGKARIRTLDLNNTATKMVVADANGVLGYKAIVAAVPPIPPATGETAVAMGAIIDTGVSVDDYVPSLVVNRGMTTGYAQPYSFSGNPGGTWILTFSIPAGASNNEARVNYRVDFARR